MRKGILLFVFCLFVLVLAANAADKNAVLSLKNINTDEAIDNVVVYVDIGRISLTEHVGSGEPLGLSLRDGDYLITLSIDEPSTEAKDYFKKQEIIVDGILEEDVYLFPVGSLRGIVKDTFDNVVGDAELRFECTNEIGAELPEKANKFGSFTVDYMPTGSCKIFASIGGAVGFKDVNIEHGNMTDVEISLDQTILLIEEGDYGIEGLVLLLFIVIIALVAYKYKDKLFKKHKKEAHKEVHHAVHPAAEHPKEEKPKPSRAEDILSTLNKKEKDVVEFLLSKKEETTQAAVRHNTGIPRTSLSRILASLEQKKIIHVKKVGKAVKINLTGWFLEEE